MNIRKNALLLAPVAVLCVLAGGRARAGDEERAAAAEATHTLYQAGKYPEALEAANLVIDYTTDQYGEKSAELIDPFITLGDIQRGLKHPERSIEAYGHAADLIEMNDSVFSDRLVSLLRRIGAAYSEARKNEDAAAALQRAKVITHRNYGIMNLQQIPILDALTTVYVNEGDRLSADREQMFGLRVSERRFGVDQPELVPALYHLAEWYRRTGQWAGARGLYRRAIGIIESAYGAGDLRLVPALTGIADTYRGERTLRNEGRQSLERVAQVYADAENADQVDYGRSMIDLGDWYLLTNHEEEAIATYTQAWQLMNADATAPGQAEKELGRPTRLHYDERSLDQMDPPDASGTTDSPKYVRVTFTVTEKGTVDNAVVVGANASSRVVRQVRLMVMQARYRPGFVEGKPVPMQVTLLQRWAYGENSGGAPAPTHAGSDGTTTAPGAAAGASAPTNGATTSASAPTTPATQPAGAEAAPATPPAEPGPETP